MENRTTINSVTQKQLETRSNRLLEGIEHVIDFKEERLPNLQNAEEIGILIEAKTLPSLMSLREETQLKIVREELEQIGLSPSIMTERGSMDPTLVDLKLGGLTKRRDAKGKVAKWMIAGKNIEEIAQKVYGNASLESQNKVNLWINVIKSTELAQHDIQIQFETDETGNTIPSFLGPIEIKQEPEKVKNPQISENPVPDDKLIALKYLTTKNYFFTENVIRLLGKTSNGRRYTWAQAASSLRLATGILWKRVKENKATVKEQQVWDRIRTFIDGNNFAEGNQAYDSLESGDLLNKLFKEHILESLDPRKKDNEASKINETTDINTEDMINNHYSEQEESNNIEQISLDAQLPPTAIEEVPDSSLKVNRLEQEVPDIRIKAQEVLTQVNAVPMLTKPSSYAQITGAFRGVALADIRLAVQQKFVKPKRGSIGRETLTAEEVAVVLLRKSLSKDHSFTTPMKKELLKIVTEEQEKIKQQEKGNKYSSK